MDSIPFADRKYFFFLTPFSRLESLKEDVTCVPKPGVDPEGLRVLGFTVCSFFFLFLFLSKIEVVHFQNPSKTSVSSLIRVSGRDHPSPTLASPTPATFLSLLSTYIPPHTPYRRVFTQLARVLLGAVSDGAGILLSPRAPLSFSVCRVRSVYLWPCTFECLLSL